MAAHIAIGLGETDKKPRSDVPTYWSAENHQAKDGNVYLRAEEWLQDLKDYTLPVRHGVVDVNLPMGQAILRYREELKMYAALADQAAGEGRALDAMDDVSFLDERHRRMKEEWPQGKERALWWAALEQLRQALDAEIARVAPHGHGAFVKFSVRSPKDAAMVMPSYRALIERHVAASGVAPEHPEALSADVRAIKHAAWMALRCLSGEDALLLFVRSDRIYLDVLQHELFCQGDKSTAFDLKVHVFEFFTGFDPDYEFRAFCSQGKRTGLTIYNPWVFDRHIIEQQEAILAKINALWDQAAPHIRSENYSLDFAVAPDLSGCWIVELNNFLPPLAGSGLFDWYSPADRQLILEGPFEFRIKTTPVTPDDFRRVKVDPDTQEKTTIIMQPATPETMNFVQNCRRVAHGLSPIPFSSSSSSTPTTTTTTPTSPSSSSSSSSASSSEKPHQEESSHCSIV